MSELDSTAARPDVKSFDPCIDRGSKKSDHRPGLKGVYEYRCWVKMRHRCRTPTGHAYHLYGGRGIRVCDRWMESYANFIADVGPAPSERHTIDRIDANGNYEPGNVRWADGTTQSRNRRNNRTLTLHGMTQTISAWAVETGMPDPTIRSRMRAGWPAERIFGEPVRKEFSHGRGGWPKGRKRTA